MYLAMKLGLRYYTLSDPKATQEGAMRVNIVQTIKILKTVMDDMNRNATLRVVKRVDDDT